MRRDYSRNFLGSVGCINGERVSLCLDARHGDLADLIVLIDECRRCGGAHHLSMSPSDARALARGLEEAARKAEDPS